MKGILRDALPEFLAGIALALLTTITSLIERLSFYEKIIGILFLLLIIVAFYLFYNRSKDHVLNVAKQVGILIENEKTEVEINLDGSYEWTTSYKIKPTRYQLDAFNKEFSLYGSLNFSELEVSVENQSDNYRLEKDIISRGPNHFTVIVRISPSVPRDESIEFKISYKSSDGVIMYRELIAEQIGKRNWLFENPFEYTGMAVKMPTRRLTFRAKLPPKYPVHGQEFFDILSPQGMKSLDYLKEKIRDDGQFSEYYDKQGRTVLEFDLENPLYGIKYIVKWKPPVKSEYEKLLSDQTV